MPHGSTWLAFSLAAIAKISTEDREMAEDSVAIDTSIIQELIKTVKSLQSGIAELKSRGNGVNKLLTQTEPSRSATLPQNGSEIRGKSPLVRDLERGTRMMPTQMTNLNQVMKMTTCSHFQRLAVPSWRQCSRLKWSPLLGGRRWQSLHFPTVNDQKHLNLIHLLLLPSQRTSLNLTTPPTKLSNSD